MKPASGGVRYLHDRPCWPGKLRMREPCRLASRRSLSTWPVAIAGQAGVYPSAVYGGVDDNRSVGA